MKLGKFLKKFVILLLLVIIVSCSGGSSTQSVEDIGDDTQDDNSGGDSGGIIPEPVASFTISSNGGEAPIDITFTSTSTGEVNSWFWNIDDDSDIESLYSTFTHRYENEGTYDVTLTVVGPGGQDVYTAGSYTHLTLPTICSV